jgi:hypothetical protein
MSEVNQEQPNEGDSSNQVGGPTPSQSETPQAPQAAEPKPVQVSPADQSEPKTDNVLGKDYEVTPDRGYRQVQEQQAQSSDEDSEG